jgi:hypothetical protein
MEIGTNIIGRIDEETQTLHLQCDLLKEGRLSQSGKSKVIASTHGYVQVALIGTRPVRLNLNLITK